MIRLFKMRKVKNVKWNQIIKIHYKKIQVHIINKLNSN